MRGVLLFLASPRKSKQKEGDPGSVPATPVPCATRDRRGLRNSGLRPSNSPRPFSASPCVARHLPKGPEKRPEPTAHNSFEYFSWPKVIFNFSDSTCFRDAFWVPLRGAEQRRRAGGSRLALSEPQASSGKPPGLPSSGRNPAGAPTTGSPFLWLLSFGEAKESTPALKAESSGCER